MNLLLTGNKDQALLALVVQEADKACQKNQGYLGRTAVQKILYFLSVLGVPMRYRFDIYHFGPYCEDITKDMEWLMADQVIADKSPDATKYSKYAPGQSLNELLSHHEERLQPFKEQVAKVVNALVPLQPDHLELIATLDYAYRQVKATTNSSPAKEAVLARFHDFKGDKFTRQEISQTYDQLVEAGLFQ